MRPGRLRSSISRAGQSQQVINLVAIAGTQVPGNAGYQDLLAPGTLNFANVAKATPTINTSQQPASATVGTSIADKATVTGWYNPPVRSRSTCTTTRRHGHAPVHGHRDARRGGTATSAGYTATATGTDYWVATYNGDSNNNAVTSGTAAEPVTISAATPTLTTTPGGTVGTRQLRHQRDQVPRHDGERILDR